MTPRQPIARGAWRARAVFCTLGDRPRPRRKLHGFPKTHFREFRLGPRASRLGLFAGSTRGRIGIAFDRPAVRPLGSPRGLCARHAAARRRLPDRGLFAATVAVSAQPRPVRRRRHRLYRQRAEFDPARPLVRTAAADRDVGGVFRDRRRRPDPAAGVAGADRSFRLAQRLSDFRQCDAGTAAAAAGDAVAAVFRRFAQSRQGHQRSKFRIKAGPC